MREPATCSHCGHTFEPPAQLEGGIANCTKCGLAVEVPGLRDPLWYALRVGAFAAAAALAWLVGEASTPWLGAAAGAGLLLGGWLLSRAL